jgi:hypothetical protein
MIRGITQNASKFARFLRGIGVEDPHGKFVEWSRCESGKNKGEDL